MDRISALRNVEEALADYEAGEASLADLERRVQTVLRTYATEFDAGEDLAAYRATGDPPADGLVVVADSPAAARERVRSLVENDSDSDDAGRGDGDRDAGRNDHEDGDAEHDDGDDLAHDDHNAGHDNADPDHDDGLDFDVTPVDR